MTNAYIALALGLVLYFILLRPLFAKRIERKVTGMCRNAGNKLLAEPLMERVREGDVERVRAVLKHCRIDPDMTDERGYSALRYALEARDLEMARIFLLSGAKVNTTWEDGSTPLSLSQGHAELTALLKQFGAVGQETEPPSESAPPSEPEPGAS